MTLLDKITLVVATFTIALVVFDFVWRSFSFSIRKVGVGLTVVVIVVYCIVWWMGGG